MDNNFSIDFLDTEDGLAKVEIDKTLSNYSEKGKVPFLLMLQLEIVEPNEVEHAEDNETEELNETEESILEFFEESQQIMLVGRVSIGGWRDSLFYMDAPNFSKRSLTKILDDINEDRGVNFSIEEDPNWDVISEFL